MDTIFFISAKLVGATLRIDTWILVALGGIVLALMLERRRLALWISSVTVVAVLVLTILPLGDVALQPLERRYPTNPALTKVDGIIVLGGAEDVRASAYWGQIQLNESGERFTAALALARRFPEARLLFAGGSGALRDLGGRETSEAAVAAEFFRDQGIPAARLLLEGRSRNTAENARFSRELAQPARDDVWVLVTSASHMPRAMRSFEAAGWTGLVAWPVDYRTSSFRDGVGWNLTRNLKILNGAIQEQIGQIAYRVTGR